MCGFVVLVLWLSLSCFTYSCTTRTHARTHLDQVGEVNDPLPQVLAEALRDVGLVDDDSQGGGTVLQELDIAPVCMWGG